MLPMPALLQMQLLQQQMMGGGGGGAEGIGMGMSPYDSLDDEIYETIDPSLLAMYWMEGFGHGNAHGQINGQLHAMDQASQYYQYMMQQMAHAHRMQLMGYHGPGQGMRSPRRRAKMQMARMMRLNNGGVGGIGMGVRGMIGGGVGAYAGFGGGGGRALMGSPFGMDPVRGNQLALMASPWGGG